MHSKNTYHMEMQRQRFPNPYSTVNHSYISELKSQNHFHYHAHTQMYTGFLYSFYAPSRWERRKLQMILFPFSDAFVVVRATERSAFEYKSYCVPAVYSLAQQPTKNAVTAKNRSIKNVRQHKLMCIFNLHSTIVVWSCLNNCGELKKKIENGLLKSILFL